MSDVSAVVLEARTALATLHSASTRPNVVKNADEALARIKTQLTPVSCIQVSRLLLTPLLNPLSHSAPISVPETHFGFHILIDLLLRANQPWASFPDEVRAAVREIAELLFLSVSQVNAQGARVHSLPPVVIEKTVDLLAGVAIREWPQRWPDFLDKLLAETQRAETACHVLRAMSEEIYEYADQIESSRRQELMHAMALTLPQTLSFLTTAMDAFHQQKRFEALSATMQTLGSFLSWASLHSVFQSGVPRACLALLHDRDVRDAALLALGALVKRQFDQAGQKPDKDNAEEQAAQDLESENAYGLEVFRGLIEFAANSSIMSIAAYSPFHPSDALPQLVRHSKMEVPNDVDAEEHTFRVQFINTLSDLGTVNFSPTFLLSRRTGVRSLSLAEEHIGRAFLDVVLCASASPSPSLRLAVLPFFTSSLGSMQKHLEESFELQGIRRFLVVGYLHASCISLLSFDGEEDPLIAQFTEMDASDDERLQKELHENFVARTISSIGVAAKLCPAVACTSSLKRLIQLLSDPIRHNVENAKSEDLRPLLLVDRLALIVPELMPHGWAFANFPAGAIQSWSSCVENTAMAAEAIIAGASASKLSYPQEEIYQLMVQGFTLSMGLSERRLRPMKAALLRIFTPLYANDRDKLEQCFSVLAEHGTNMAESGSSRFRSCLALSTLCKRLGRADLKSLRNCIQPMCEHAAKNLVNAKFESVNKTLLLEASVSTLLVLDNIAEQAVYVEALMQPVLRVLDLSKLRPAFGEPTTLFAFVCDKNKSKDLVQVCEALQVLEAVTHQIVRPNAKSTNQITLPIALSRSIAPACVEIGAILTHGLHGLYNDKKFPKDDPEDFRKSILHPTSKEIAALLNLGVESSHRRREHVHDLAKTEEDKRLGSRGEQMNSDVLRQYGMTPPEPKHNRKREIIRNLRRSAYEVMRSAILSGVTLSPGHMQTLLHAVAADCHYAEPLHLVELTNKVLRPLFSFPVIAGDSRFLQSVANSEVVTLLRIIREHVQASRLSELLHDENPLLDVARDYGRKTLARSVAGLLSSMYPRVDGISPGTSVFMPPVFAVDVLGDEVASLWKEICDPGRGFLDRGSARVGFELISTALDMSPTNAFPFFGALLQASFLTAVANDGLGSDSPLDSAIGAVVSGIRKWPEESNGLLQELARVHFGDMSAWISECTAKIAGSSDSSSKPKKHRAAVRALVTKVAEQTGRSNKRASTVKALPEKLVATNPGRRRKRLKSELQDTVLEDAALESLFGDGDPL